MTTYEGIPLSKISPSFLHANSTSHTWPFSAIAELIDNAYDPDVSAKELWIDKATIHGNTCLTFQDNGNGMDHDHLLKMLSFGFCEKDAYRAQASHMPIGHYGNGFKSGSMRLARDAIVFTVCKTSASVGFLSTSYLKEINVDSIIVPMIEYSLPNMEQIKSSENCNNLEAILKYSLYSREKDIQAELQNLRQQINKTGTKIVLYNLKTLANGRFELDFDSDTLDIRNPEVHEEDHTSVYSRTSSLETSEYILSLRAYCSILFRRPRMKIYIRGVQVKCKPITTSFTQAEKDLYKPTWLQKPLGITFGFVPNDNPSHQKDYGVMFYHNNRLIKAYEKLGYQKQPNGLGVGVVGVVNVDFLKPIHNKQDFLKDEKYNSIMSAIGNKLNDYWNEKMHTTGSKKTPGSEEKSKCTWAQCDQCMKWRRLPLGITDSDLPAKWYCHMNPDPTHNRCDAVEEKELDDEEEITRPTYKKQAKKEKREQKRKSMEAFAIGKLIQSATDAALAQNKEDQNTLVEDSTELATGVTAVSPTSDSLTLPRAVAESQKRQINSADGTPRSDKETLLNYTSAANVSTEESVWGDSCTDMSHAPRSKRQRKSSEESCSLLTPPKEADFNQTETGEHGLPEKGYSSIDQDIKPNIDILRATVTNYKDSLVKGEVTVKSEFKEEIGVQVDIAEEETEHVLLTQKHAILQQRFEKFQHDVFTLLTFILDEIDIGEEEDIEMTVEELIRENLKSYVD